MPSRRDVIKGAAALPLALSGAGTVWSPAHAQQFPSKTIIIVVPFPPGGVADYASRPLAAYMTEKLPHPAVVENRGGAGGGVGHAYVARAVPDGHTIMVALPSLAVIPEANRIQKRPVNYEMTDFVPIGRMLADAPFLAVKKDAKWKNLEEFVADVKANPGKIAYGSSGLFGTVHLAMEIFLNSAGLQMNHIPYTGGGPAFTALMADQVPIIPTLDSIVKPQLDAGNLRVLAQFGDKRLPQFPNVPTFQEAGYKDVLYILWSGAFAPAKTPQAVQKVLGDVFKDFMTNPATIERFTKGGSQVGYLDGPAFAKFLEADSARLVNVTRSVKLT